MYLHNITKNGWLKSAVSWCHAIAPLIMVPNPNKSIIKKTNFL